MKKTLTFLLLGFFSIGIFAQKDLQQEITTLKKQVGSLKFENNKLKKLINDTTLNQNSKIISLEKLLYNISNNLKKQANSLEKNNTSISELKEEFITKNNFTKILTWCNLIILLIVIGYVVFINMKWNKSKEEILAQINSLRQALDNHIIQVNSSVETKLNQYRKEISDQMEADKKTMENMLDNHSKTTKENIQSINNSIQEYKNSSQEQMEFIKMAIESQNSAIEAQKTEMEKHKNQIKEQEKIMESNKAALEIMFKTDTSKMISELNKTISTLKTDMEKLKNLKADTNINHKSSKNNKNE